VTTGVIIVVYGEDELARKRRLQQLRDEADGGTGMLETNMNVIAGRDAKPADILGQAMAMPFLSPKRLVLVEDFLERFRAPRAGQGGEVGESRAVKQFEPLFEGLANGIPESTVLVFTGGSALKTHPFLRAIGKVPGTLIEEYPAIKKNELPRFVREEAAMRGVHFRNGPSKRPLPQEDEWRRPTETDPAILLANLHQPNNERGNATPDTLSIANELQKLSLYAMGRDVTVDDVDEVCSGQRDPNRWAFQDWVMDGELAPALNALEYFGRTDGSFQPLLGLLMSGYRTLATVLDLVEDRASTDEIRRAIGRNFGEDRYVRRAKGLGRDGLRAAYEAMVGTDRAIKAGDMEEGIAMSVLVTRLCELGRRRQPAGRR